MTQLNSTGISICFRENNDFKDLFNVYLLKENSATNVIKKVEFKK